MLRQCWMWPARPSVRSGDTWLCLATDSWSPLSVTERAERYATWPTWRRSVRPVGVDLYWAGVIWFTTHADHKTTALIVTYVVWAALMLTFAAVGIRDWTLRPQSTRARD